MFAVEGRHLLPRGPCHPLMFHAAKWGVDTFLSPSVSQSERQSVSQSIKSVCQSASQSIKSVSQPVFLSVCLSVCLSIKSVSQSVSRESQRSSQRFNRMHGAEGRTPTTRKPRSYPFHQTFLHETTAQDHAQLSYRKCLKPRLESGLDWLAFFEESGLD